MNRINEYGLYIHLPFCNKRCPYCAFFSSVSEHHLVKSYIEAAVLEYSKKRDTYQGFPGTVYFGGGTPSIIPAELLKSLISVIPLDNVREFTVESNPDSLTEEWMKKLLQTGVNRLSIGVQSFSDSLLSRLGRLHNAEKAVWAVNTAKRAGFANISIDLMFGIPGQTIDNWLDTLDKTISLEPRHISSYSLTIEEDTVFMDIARKQGLQVPGPGEIADMYFIQEEELARAGYIKYEISNFSLPGSECEHNMKYWDHSPYLGVGAAAHSFVENKRIWNIKDISLYIDKCNRKEDPSDDLEIIDISKRIIETIMLSLRTSSGLDLKHLRHLIAESKGNENLGKDNEIGFKCKKMVRNGFLVETGHDVFVLTAKGAMVSDEIIAELISTLD